MLNKPKIKKSYYFSPEALAGEAKPEITYTVTQPEQHINYQKVAIVGLLVTLGVYILNRK